MGKAIYNTRVITVERRDHVAACQRSGTDVVVRDDKPGLESLPSLCWAEQPAMSVERFNGGHKVTFAKRGATGWYPAGNVCLADGSALP